MPKPLTDAVPVDDEPTAAAAATPDPSDAPDDNPETTAATTGEAASGVEDPDAAPDAEAADDDEDGRRAEQSGRVPQSRVNELAERRKAAEARADAREQENIQLRWMLQQVLGTTGNGGSNANAAPAKARDFEAEYDALVTQYDSGAIDEAKFRRDERKLNIAQAKAEITAEYEPKLQALQQQRTQELQAQQAEAWTKEVQAAIKAYPFLNHEADAANKEAIAAVRAETEELMAAGIDAARALRLAVRDVAPQYGDAASPTADDVAAARKKKAREAVADAENQQPSALAGTGNGVRVQGKQRLTASVKDFDKWDKTPEAQRDQAFTA